MKKYIIAIAAGAALCFAGFALASGDTFHPPVKRGGFVIGAAAGYAELNTVYPFENFNKALEHLNNSGVTYSQDLGDFAWGAHIGYDHQLATTGWLSHMLLGIEAGYKYLGKSTYKTEGPVPLVQTAITTTASYTYARKVEYKSQAIDVMLKADAYLIAGWHVFAKAGFAELYTQYQYKYENNVPGSLTPGTWNQHYWSLRPEYQLGTGYAFTVGPQRNMHIDVFAYYDHISTEPWSESIGTDPYAYGSVANGGNDVAIPGANMVMGGVAFTFNPFV